MSNIKTIWKLKEGYTVIKPKIYRVYHTYYLCANEPDCVFKSKIKILAEIISFIKNFKYRNSKHDYFSVRKTFYE